MLALLHALGDGKPPRPEVHAALKVLQEALGTHNEQTFGQVWDAYVEAERGELASWESQRARGERLIIAFGHRPVTSLTLADVDAYRTHRRRQITKPGTRNREMSLLRRVLNFAVERGMIQANPLRGMTMEAEHNARMTVLTEDVMDRLLAACEPALAALLLTLYDSGLRRNEGRRLRWNQVDEDWRVHLAPRDTKTKTGRVVKLTGRVVEAINALPHLGSPYVFTNPNTGEPYSKSTLGDRFRAAVAKAGIDGAEGETPWLHDLRRSFVTLGRRRGIPESEIVKLTGHKTHAVFKRYCVVSFEDGDAAMAKMEAGIKADRLRLLDGKRHGPKRADHSGKSVDSDSANHAVRKKQGKG